MVGFSGTGGTGTGGRTAAAPLGPWEGSMFGNKID